MRYIIAALLSVAFIWHTTLNNQSTVEAQRTSKPITNSQAAQKTPTPVPAAAPAKVVQAAVTASVVPQTYAKGCSTYDSMFRKYDWNVQVMEAICQAESGGNPYAVSSTADYGLMQLHDEEIFNPSANIAAAYRKYETQGLRAWTTYKTGAYLRFM